MTCATSEWSTFHGDAARSGNVTGSAIDTSTIGNLKELYTKEIGGAILSVPAIANGSIYVGTANGTVTKGQQVANGGTFHKIDLATGDIQHSYYWPVARHEGDTHGFTGMGCTPAIVDGRVYFSAFDGKLRCLDAETLAPVWCTDLRNADPGQDQPITNIAGTQNPDIPQAEGWCSPLVVNGRVYVGIGEGENPDLYSFIFCLCAEKGKVLWVFCTNLFQASVPNTPNILPAELVDAATLPAQFSTTTQQPLSKGSSVWSALSYDEGLDRIFCCTGNPQPVDNGLFPPPPPYSYGILALDAQTGADKGFFQAIPESSYRNWDIDIDFGGSPMLFDRDGVRCVSAICKNGSIFVLNAETLELLQWRQCLPYYNDGGQIPTVDKHGPDDGDNPNPPRTNAESNNTPAENFYGSYSTPAVCPGQKRLFVGIGGNNYHYIAPGIDHTTTPFLRALDWDTLDDAWPMDDSDPKRYIHPAPPMYETAGESGLSAPAVVNDVVFCSTSKIAIYAFDASDGTLLFSDGLGTQTLGMSGGYGYCLGMAISGNYVVAGGLVLGRDGGVLRVFGLKDPA